MPNYFKDIEDFHRHFGLISSFRDNPGMIDPEIMKFRLSFILEELTELSDSCGFIRTVDKFHYDERHAKDLHGALDAFVDLWYVLVGTMQYMGIKEPLFAEAWNRVHSANMKKVRVASSSESKRGSKFDVRKPEGWVAPTFHDLLTKNTP